MKMAMKRCIIAIFAMIIFISCACAEIIDETGVLTPKVFPNYNIPDYFYSFPEGRCDIALLAMMEFAFGTGRDFDCIDIYGDSFTGLNEGIYNITFRFADGDQHPWVIMNYEQSTKFCNYYIVRSEDVTADVWYSAFSTENSDGVFKNKKADMKASYNAFEEVIGLESVLQSIN